MTLVTARNPPNLDGVLLGFILIDCDHFGTYSTISRECYIFVTLWHHTCYTCYSDLKLGTEIGVTHINIIIWYLTRYQAKKYRFTHGSTFFTTLPKVKMQHQSKNATPCCDNCDSQKFSKSCGSTVGVNTNRFWPFWDISDHSQRMLHFCYTVTSHLLHLLQWP